MNTSNSNSMGSLSDIVSHPSLHSLLWAVLQLWIIALIFRCDIFFLDYLYCKLMLLGVKEGIVFIYQESFLHFFVWSFFNPLLSLLKRVYLQLGNIRSNNFSFLFGC